jgi:hypothetical protein
MLGKAPGDRVTITPVGGEVRRNGSRQIDCHVASLSSRAGAALACTDCLAKKMRLN